jgi:hypothetical protein
MTDTAPEQTTDEPAPAVFHTVIAELPAYDADDDELAGHTPEWRRGWAAGWAAARKPENVRGNVPLGAQLDQSRLVWSLADAAAAMYPLGPPEPLPRLAPSGLVAGCPDPPDQLTPARLLAWEYANAADLPDLLAALAAPDDPDAQLMVRAHLGPLPRHPDAAGVDVRPVVRFGAYCARASWSVVPHVERAEQVADLGLTDPDAPAYLAERVAVLTAANAGWFAARFGQLADILDAATQHTRWTLAAGVGVLPWENVRAVNVSAARWVQ